MFKKILSSFKNLYYKYKAFFTALITVIVILVLFNYIKSKRDDIALVLRISPANIILLIIASLFSRLVLSYNFKILMLFYKIKLRFREWFGLMSISAMTNYFLPAKGGSAAQAIYLKKIYRFNYTHFLSSLIGFYAIFFLVTSVLGAISSLFIFHSNYNFAIKLFIFFLALAVILTALFLSFKFSWRFISKWGFLKKLSDGLKEFHNNPIILTRFILLQLLLISTITLRLFFAFKSIGVNLGLISCLMVALLTSFSLFVGLTPANLGIKEFFITIFSNMLGVSASQAIMAAIIDRTIDILITFLPGMYFSYLFNKDIHESRNIHIEL